MIKNLSVSVIIFLILSFHYSAHTETSSHNIGQAAGAYLGATDIMVKVSESKCGIFTENRYNFNSSLNEVMSYLNEQEKKELTDFLNGEGMRIKRRNNVNLVNTILNPSESKEYSDDFACGLLIGTASTLYRYALTNWNNVKKYTYQHNTSKFETQHNKYDSKYCSGLGDIFLIDSYHKKNTDLEKELYRIEITDGKWSRSYRSTKKQLQTRTEQFGKRKSLIEELCKLKDPNSTEYKNLEMKIGTIEDVLEMKDKY